MPDYRSYHLSWKEKIIGLLITFGIGGMVSWLFYHSMYAMLSVVVLYRPVKQKWKNYLWKKQKSEMLFQFKEILQMASAALKAGYSMENAFVEARRDFVRLYGEHTIIAKEFLYLNQQVQMNVPLEQILGEFGERSGIEEINSFSQVFGFAKRSGGDFVKIFQNTVEKIRQKAEVMREIETVMASKRLEQNIMNLVPFGILAYVGMTSPEFLEQLYGSLFGIVVMTVCLVVYLIAYGMAEKIVNIQV